LEQSTKSEAGDLERAMGANDSPATNGLHKAAGKVRGAVSTAGLWRHSPDWRRAAGGVMTSAVLLPMCFPMPFSGKQPTQEVPYFIGVIG
jgi:hypothetical protein